MEGVPASRMSSNIRVRSSEALMTAEHTLESESVLTRTTYDGNAGYTFSTVKKLNNDSVEVGLLTLQSKVSPVVHTAGFLTTEHRLDGESSLKRTDHDVQKHSFFSVSTSSPNEIMGLKNTRRVGSSPNINIRSKSTLDISPSLLDSGKAINGGECQQTQTLKRHQSGVKSREGSEESRLQFQRCKPWADLAREFPQKQLHQQNLQRFHGIKHSQGASPSKKFHQKKLQQSHAIMFSQGVKNSREHALPALNKEDNPSSRISIKPSLLEDSLEGLKRRSAPPIDTSSIKNSGVSVSSESITREKTFMEGSFTNKPGSWLTFAFLTLLIVCSCLTLKILLLEIEIARQHGLLERCTSVDFDMVTKGLEEQPNKRDSGIAFQEMFMKGLSKVALLVIIVHLLCVPFLLKNKIHQLYELSRKFITGTEEDAPIDKRIAYGVDILFSTRPYMKATALLLATVLLICGGGIALFTVSDDSISDAMWRAWTYVADSGNHADSEGTWPRIVSVLISFGGMLIFALMLGLISDAISEKVDSLRKGKSEVIESGHTLILGWSDKLGSLLKQLAIANQSLGGGVVVVLAERDKEEMELDIAKLEFNFMGTSVICRSGSPLIMADLKKVSVSKARAIIVLAEIDNADQSDARALRVVLSLAGIKEGLKGHIVVEMRDLDNEALVKLVGGEMVETVVAHDVIGRLMIQCARQPGLAQIWEDILGFEKAEFYIKRWPELDGMCFGEVLISFPDAIPCGVKVYAEAGRIVLNPDDDYLLCEGDEILVIAEDDDTYAPAHLPQVRESPLLQAKRSQKKPQKILLCGWRRDIEDMITVSFSSDSASCHAHTVRTLLQVRRRPLPSVVMPPSVPEKILFCGWRRDIQDMIKVLDAFLASGSEVWIFSDVPECDREKKLLYGNLIPENLENIQLVHREGNTVIRRHLESLPLEDFDSILILADEKLEDTVVNADSSSLATLLLIRDIQSKRLPLEVSRGSYNRAQVHSQSSWIREMHEASNKTIIISEILDSRTKNLVSVSKISDYVLSNELVSMALAMVAEDKQINRVLEELFAEEGNELYIRPAEFYLYDQEEVSFFEIMIRARQREEIVIGYRQASADQAVINPSNKDALQRWSLQDVFVVLAFEE